MGCPGAVQGTFVECASPARVTLWLASVVLELVAAKEVHAHSQPFVRRSALIAASQACPFMRTEWLLVFVTESGIHTVLRCISGVEKDTVAG
jgi:hypothetical protein